MQLVRALEKNWMSRRLLLWRHQREATEAQQVSMMIHHERQTMEEQMLALEAARDSAVAQVTTTEVALSEAREGLQTTLLQHTDLVVQNENLATQLRAYKSRASREEEMEAELKKVRFELRVVEEELRLSQDLTQTVRVTEASAEVEASKRQALQDRIDAACQQLEVDGVAQEERLDVLVVLAKRCWAAQRERDNAAELRQSLSRQVADLTQQLSILEEENTLLRNLGMAAPLRTVPGANALVDALDDKDTAIEVLTQRARELEKKLEAMSAELDNAMGQLAVTVIRARDLPRVDEHPCDPYVCVAVDKQLYKTQVRQGSAAPEWNESFLFSVSSGTKDLVLTVSDWSGGKRERVLGTATIQLSDISFSLNQPHHAWVPLQMASAGTASINSDGSSEGQDGARGAVMVEVRVYALNASYVFVLPTPDTRLCSQRLMCHTLCVSRVLI